MCKYLLPLLPILILGGVLRVLWLDSQPWWFDEALTWRFVDFPLEALLAGLAHPDASHPPLYYFCLRAWAACTGDSEIALRAFSAACGLFTILAAYGCAIEAVRLDAGANPPDGARWRWTALTAALLIAVSVSQVHVARQARMYALATALLALGSWSLLRAVRSAVGAPKFWLLFGLAALALLYTHALGTFALVAQATFLLWYFAAEGWSVGLFRARSGPGMRARRATLLRQAGWAVATLTLVALAYLPLLPLQMRKAAGISWRVVPSVAGVLRETTTAWLSTFAAPLDPPLVVTAALSLVVVALPVVLLFQARWAGRYLAVASLVPTLLMLAYSFYTDRSIFFPRYLTLVQLLWFVALAYWLGTLRWPTRLTVLGVFLLITAGIGYRASWGIIGPVAQPGMRGAMDYLARQRQDNEPILAQRSITLIKARYHLRDGPWPRCCAPIPSRHLQTQTPFLDAADMLAQDEAMTLEAPGIWVLSTSWYNETKELAFPVPGHWELLERQEFPQNYPGEGPVVVWHYRPREPAAAGGGE